jgi:hypothetical protein
MKGEGKRGRWREREERQLKGVGRDTDKERGQGKERRVKKEGRRRLTDELEESQI